MKQSNGLLLNIVVNVTHTVLFSLTYCEREGNKIGAHNIIEILKNCNKCGNN